MNITDRLYTEWAWRTKTGIPDINNPEDKLILDNLIKELADTDGKVSKEDIKKALETGDFTPEQLQFILNTVSGFAYKADIISFLNDKGKSVSSVSNSIYNVLINNGDVQNYHEYITKNPIAYNQLGSKGNLKTKFSKILSQSTIDFLLDLKPSVGNIATGKGEVFLCVLTQDVNGDSDSGDVKAGNKGVEVKNRGAIPMGQKAEFNKNTDKTLIAAIKKGIGELLGVDFEVKTAGNRPIHRFNVLFNEVVKIDRTKLDDAISIADKAIKENYKDVDFSNFQLANFKQGNGIDADKVEIELGRKIVELYTKVEDFDEVFFLDDKSGNFAVVPTDQLANSVGNSIHIFMKDGLPRWSYKF